MAQALDAFAVDVDVVVTPQGFEFGAQPAEFVDERPTSDTAPARAASARNAPTTKPRHAFPIVLRRADARIAKDEAKDVALAGRERAVVGQHRGGGAIPCDDVPGGGLDQRGAGIERIEQTLQAGRDAFGRRCSGPRADDRVRAGRDVRARCRSASAHGRSGSSTSADGAPPRPCSSHVYQVGLMLARWATSSRRSPGVRRRPPQNRGRPDRAGCGDP